VSIEIDKQIEETLLGSIKRFFIEELDEDIGDLKAAAVLDFFVKEIGPSVYNQAIADAQTFMTERVDDLGGARYQPELDYWKRPR